MAVNRERQKKYRDKGVSLDLEYSTLVDVKEQLERLIETFGEDAEFREYQDPYSDSDRVYYHVATIEMETDKEYNNRIAQEEKWEAEQNERDRKNYEALKRKFEGKV